MTSNVSEDPPLVLEEGTEVSAKFKGAFCEAKIKKVDRIVKCKIMLKTSNESLTVNDTQILNQLGQKIPINDLKQGQTIYISKSNDGSNLQQATLNRIIDQSVYSVVFNDGDEKTLKRSFIRFKGEKHYLDSETLNNAPLNNPEHFLYPIKSQNKNSPNSSLNEPKRHNESENESETESVSNTTCTSLSLKNKKEKEIEDDEADDDETSSTSSSDDYPSEEKDLFVAQLYKFMDDRGTPMNKVPSINKIDIDLHKLFVVVKKFGGYNKVNKQRSWSDVYKRVGLPSPSCSNVINLKCSYKKYLHPYEELSRKLGGSMLVSSSASKRSISSDSKRLFNARYLTPSSQKKVPKTHKKTAEVSEQISQQEASQQQESENAQNDSLNQEKEFTIESLANACNDEINQQSQEELTLSGMVKNLNENFKKAKKEVKKRLSSSKPKIRRTSADKVSEHSKKSEEDEYDENEGEDEEENDDEEEEMKKRKKAKRSTDVSEESNSTSATRVSKRKSSTSRPNEDESESERKSNDSSLRHPSHDSDGKKIYRSCDIELNKIVEVKYGSGKTTYHAKIVQVNEENQTMLVHYLGWNNRYDEWIKINQILKIFSDDYGAYKRRKPAKTDQESLSPSQTKSKSDSKNHKLGKRSSLSSTSSSSSAETSIKKEPQISAELKQKEVKIDKKNAPKMRSSDSSSSISSSSEPLTLSVSAKCKKNCSNDSSIFEKEQKSMELELEKIKNTQPETLLSIKEEIIDFEPNQNEDKEEKITFIKSITDELVDKCLVSIADKAKCQEYKPKTMCKKDELIPVFSSEMVVLQSNKFIVKAKNDEPVKSPKTDTFETKQKSDEIKDQVEDLQKTKLVLNESSLNTTSQISNIVEVKVAKEKENTKQVEPNLPKYPFHLIGCKLVGKQKIRFIEEQMRLCREEYAKLKNEMAAIDRKKKKLKRNLLEKSASNTNSAIHEDMTKIESKK